MRRVHWLLAPGLFVAMVLLGGFQSTFLMGDFRAFYCAGAAVAHGANPYLEEPLRSCEEHAGPPQEPAELRGVALPAPLPPPALALFVPFSLLPFVAAAALYTLLSIVASTAAVALFARVAGIESVALNVAFAAVSATVTFYVGQPVPFVFLALAGAALLARRGRWTWSALCAVAATIEPHLALPAIAGMLVALPRTRVPLVLAATAFAVFGCAALGVPATIAYVREVIPAHALANAFEWQFSLTSLLTSAGIAAAPAIRAGEVMFAAMTLAGVAAALRLRRMTGDDAVAVIVPPAFAVFGGVHVHFQQLLLAFPAICYVLVRYPRVRALAASGIALAMIPWNVLGMTVFAGAAPLFAWIFGALTLDRRLGLRLAVAATCIVFSFYGLALLGAGPHHAAYVAHPANPGALAETSWGDYSHAQLTRASFLMQWLRIPTLAGLACGLLAVARVAFAGASVRARFPAAAAAPVP